MPSGSERRAALFAVALVASFGCGEHGLLPTTVDPGPDFSVADVLFDEGFYYCRVEPMLFARSCGSGDPSQGDAANGCHYNVTSFRLTEYMPLVADSCGGGVTPGQTAIGAAARQNYQSAQSRMRRDPDQAPLLLRATGVAKHPRAVFSSDSPEAEVIRQWATQYSTR